MTATRTDRTGRTTASLLSLAKEARGDGKHYDTARPDAAIVLRDALRDAGHDALADYLVRNESRRLHNTTPEEAARRDAEIVITHFAALELQDALGRIDWDALPPSRETLARCGARTLAPEVRRLLKAVGLKPLSVRVDCGVVRVRLPGRKDYTTYHEDGMLDYQSDPASAANRAAERDVQSLLSWSFPNHGDRSDSSSDYFDYCWAVDTE